MLLTLRFSLEIGKLHSIERMCMAKKWRHWYESQRRSGYKSDMWWKCAIAITDPITLTMVRRHQLIPLKLWNTLFFWMNMIIELGLLRIEWLWFFFVERLPFDSFQGTLKLNTNSWFSILNKMCAKSFDFVSFVRIFTYSWSFLLDRKKRSVQ